MAASTSPIFPLTPNLGVANAVLTTAMTNSKALDGTETAGTAFALVYTAGVNGSRVDKIKIRVTGTQGGIANGVTTNATVVRVWLNNGSVNTTANNNWLLAEVSVPSTTVDWDSTTIHPEYIIEGVDIPTLPASYKIYAGTNVAAATNTAIHVMAFGGDY